MLLLILRLLASFLLGISIFAGFLWLLLVNGVSNKLLNADFYIRTLDQQNTYSRIHDQVLLDQKVKESIRRLLGDTQVVNPEDIVRLLREVAPPDYLKGQVEGVVQDSMTYFNQGADTLELHLDLGPPLAKVKPGLFKAIDQHIDGIAVVEPERSGCRPEQMEGVRASFHSFLREVAGGKLPRSVVSVKTIEPLCRSLVFDTFFTELAGDRSIDSRVRQGLVNSREDIRREFMAGDTRGVLKVAARPLVTPLIDDAMADFRRRLDRQDRLEIIPWIAGQGNVPEEELRDDIADVRDQLNVSRGWGKIAALVMVIGGVILMGMVHLPRLSGTLRWPGLTLLLTGVVVYIMGKVLASALPAALDNLLGQVATGTPEFPPSARDLASDILRSMGEQFVSGFTWPALVLMVVGVVLFASSFFVQRILPPFLSGTH